MNEIRPGLYHWKAIHPKIQIEVSSYYLADSGTLIDPMLPPDGTGWFAGPGEPQRIVLTNRHHYRQSDEVRSEFDCPVLCHEAGLHEFEGGPDVKGFRFGDELAPEITALEVGAICPEETALHVDLHEGMLAIADGLINYGELTFVPDNLLGDDPEGVKRGLRDSFGRILEHDFDTLLFAHGEPLLGSAKNTLRDFIEG